MKPETEQAGTLPAVTNKTLGTKISKIIKLHLMITTLFCILFFALILVFAVLPFIPAFVEWRHKKDDEPLNVIRNSEVDVRHLAKGFKQFIEVNMREKVEACRASRVMQRGSLADGTPYIIFGDNGTHVLREVEGRGDMAHPMILACSDLLLPEDMTFLTEIYSDGSIRTGEGDVLRALLAEEEIHLGRETTSLRWLHGGRAVCVQTGSILYGRASADSYMRIERGCRFERLHAPRIEFCYESEAGELNGGMVYRESAVLRPGDVDNEVDVAGGRWFVFGDLEIPHGRIVENDIVATGSVRIGPGVHVKGSIKSHKDIVIEKGVQVEGCVASEKDIFMGQDCRTRGPVLAEGTVFIKKGTTIGTKDHSATVNAEKIFIEPGVVIHGTVWAHTDGRVVTLSGTTSH